ncbi:pilus assembly protein PilA [Vibrio sp. T187]|nr:pilus assembly protein PilA [Vibrio sp. T187]
MNIVKITLDFVEDEQGLSVVEYVVGAAFLVSALTLFFFNYDTTLTNSLSNTLGKI